MHALEYYIGDNALELALRGRSQDDILGSYDDIDGHILAEALVDADKLGAEDTHEAIPYHNAVYYIALAYKVGDESICGLVINVNRSSYLLDIALVEHYDGIRHREGLLLVVGDIYKGYAQLLLNLFELDLHLAP